MKRAEKEAVAALGPTVGREGDLHQDLKQDKGHLTAVVASEDSTSPEDITAGTTSAFAPKDESGSEGEDVRVTSAMTSGVTLDT